MKRMLLLPLLAAGISTHIAAAAYVQSVEFPFDAYPKQLWERELVWLKNIGIHNVAFAPASRSDPSDFLGLLNRVGLSAASSPTPRFRVSALSADALVRSREILALGKGSLVWTDVESSIRPVFHKGAISFSGEEQPTLAALRRNTALLQYWGGLFGSMTVSDVNPVSAKFPEGVGARQMLFGGGASAVSLVNRSESAWRGDLRVHYPALKRAIALPPVEVPANEALWLPVNIPLGNGALCKDCAGFGNTDHIVYATAELTGVEYENGILAMEFAAPASGEVVLQLSHEPSGPLLAAAKPTSFSWDEKTSRVRLAIPAGKAPAYRVRIALAIEPPEASAFFVDAKPLMIGHENRIATSYSSEDIAKRSRLKLSATWKTRQEVKSPTEIDYLIDVPAAAMHGDHVQVELEADGVQMSHARLQLLRAASLRIREAAALHFGMEEELPVFPALISMDRTSGRDISVVIRNNFPEIRTYTLEIAGSDLEFSPSKIDIIIGASMERDVSVRVFAAGAEKGIHSAKFKLSGPAQAELAARILVIPRNETVAYREDFDGDGSPEYVLETQKVRAVFSTPDGGRWLEFVWKDSGRNVLPEAGVPVGLVRVSLKGSELTVETEARGAGLKMELKTEKKGGVLLDVRHPSANRAIYGLSR